jgi:hypothetical protein
LHNVSLSYEATTLLDAIYTELPYFIDNQVNPELINFNPHIIHQIPGEKFCLNPSHNHEIWQRSKDDVNWLCKNFKLPTYNYSDKGNETDTDKWGVETLTYLQEILHEQPPKISKIIITIMLTEIIRYKKCFTYQKKQSIFAFFIHNSVYLELVSRYTKFLYSCKYLGFGLTFSLSLDYFIHKNTAGFKR